MPRTPDEALARLHDLQRSNTTAWDQLCLKLSRSVYDVAAKYPTASDGWRGTKHRGKGTPPKGALVWWTTGRYGHVCLADGKGNVVGNWFKDGGRVRTVSISAVSAALGAQPAGWSRDINGIVVLPEVAKEGAYARLARIARQRLKKIRNLQRRLKAAK